MFKFTPKLKNHFKMKRLLIFITVVQFFIACNPEQKDNSKQELLSAESLTKEQAASLIEKDSIIS